MEQNKANDLKKITGTINSRKNTRIFLIFPTNRPTIMNSKNDDNIDFCNQIFFI